MNEFVTYLCLSSLFLPARCQLLISVCLRAQPSVVNQHSAIVPPTVSLEVTFSEKQSLLSLLSSFSSEMRGSSSYSHFKRRTFWMALLFFAVSSFVHLNIIQSIHYFVEYDISDAPVYPKTIKTLHNVSDAPADVHGKTIETINNKNTSKIPWNLIFVDTRQNILQTKQPRHLYENLQNTIQVYQNVWPSSMQVMFLTDPECRDEITKAGFPELVYYYDNVEQHGEEKSDVCRAAALYNHGGYYFDSDLKAIQPIILPPNHTISLITALPDNFPFQLANGVLVSEPRSPILRRSLNIIKEGYKIEEQHRMNKLTNREAIAKLADFYNISTVDYARGSKFRYYQKVTVEKMSPKLARYFLFDKDGKYGFYFNGCRSLYAAWKEHQAQSSSSFDTVLLLPIINLATKGNQKLYPNLPRQNVTEDYEYYQNVIHDSERKKPYFWVRFQAKEERELEEEKR